MTQTETIAMRLIMAKWKKSVYGKGLSKDAMRVLASMAEDVFTDLDSRGEHV